MELKSIAQVMEVHATLKLGTDFGVEALMPDMLTGGALQYLDHNVTDVIAKKHGFDKCCWSGHFRPEDGTVEVVLRKEIHDGNATQHGEELGVANKGTLRRQLEADILEQVAQLKRIGLRGNPELCLSISDCMVRIYNALDVSI